ncbi:hypothetical protein G6F22_016902 [Rhizopus arrhizus]|nr:hypothetical protein G6F22_016902 [Rhizopus arrhizus]
MPSSSTKPRASSACRKAPLCALAASSSSGESIARSLTTSSRVSPIAWRVTSSASASGAPCAGSGVYSVLVAPTKRVCQVIHGRHRRDSGRPSSLPRSASSIVVVRSSGARKVGRPLGRRPASNPSGGWARKPSSSAAGSSAVLDARDVISIGTGTGSASTSALGLGQRLVEQGDRQVDLFVADVQRRREGDHVLVTATHVEHEAHALAIMQQVAGQADVDHAVQQFLVRRVAVGLADFRTQGQAQAIDYAPFSGTVRS